MKKEIKKGESWRKGYQIGTSETEKAFGGCKNCYGKGYATTIEFAGSSEDFGGEKTSEWQLPRMRFCSCDRGKALKEEIDLILEKFKNCVPEEKEQLDKNNPDNYGACYAIAGFNNCREQMLKNLEKLEK